ncbi:MAG: helix-turn-helix transcriptional regulator [Pseudomonadales bacterium]|nr:helix-turn-helix transcriptional regulator [Pseudomonadales bacterium]
MSHAFAQRFQQIVDQLANGDKKQFALLTGKSASHIYKICRGLSRPSMAYLQELYDEYRIDLNWLLTGEQNQSANAAGVAPGTDLIFAPMYDVQASAGYGAAVDAECIEDYFAFNASFLSRELRVSSEQLAFITIAGDSMYPTLHDGDRVLVDMTQKNVQREGLYLLNTEDGLMAKRLSQNSSGDLQVISDNPDYTNREIKMQQRQGNEVNGKIVWCARVV